jgi:hypothetical protein
MMWLEKRHPIQEQRKRQWQSRTDSLWWNCLTTIQSGGIKKVVRGWMANRSRAAISQALERKGYAITGERLLGSVQDSGSRKLKGSAHFLPTTQMLRTSWSDLERQADLIIAELERQQTASAAASSKRKKESPPKEALGSRVLQRTRRVLRISVQK